MTKPVSKPQNPRFSAGPTTKFKGWSFDQLSGALLGRSHRSADAKARMKEVMDLTSQLLNLPEGYKIAIMPGSDTGAFEAAMWNLLGGRGVDVFAWEAFGKNWITDAVDALQLEDLRTFWADYGQLPDLSQAQKDRDIVFTWNGTTSGVKVPNADWIADDRTGLTLCDATSAVFAMELPWEKLDVTTYSWQKVLGGEAQHGIIILSPRALKRLEEYTPSWPVPILFQLAKKGKINEAIFEANTINTPSLMCIEDALIALKHVKESGGVAAMIKKSKSNLAVVQEWVDQTPWIEMVCEDPANQSNTSLCVRITGASYEALSEDEQTACVNKMVKMIEAEGAGYDFKAYRTAPNGFRIWGGMTIEADDIRALLPWIEWAYAEVVLNQAKAA